ncbi:hypothetical protein GDO78_015191 [Eleutherodactylus coqui]|uniref:Uncharacterized protein n=1 Tax=Eleutherodactylus coqui TaxID=57060 RepID=A0A8J6BF22_ELECQ|nr:hypothetical protein GDO78_015191 [Eleutherodactylus coqui]
MEQNSKKQRSQNLEKKLEELGILEASNKKAPSGRLRGDISELRNQILSILDQASLCRRNKIRGGYYEFGDKCGKWLAKAIHPKTAQTHIFAINSPGGRLLHSGEILDKFQKYYKDLYKIK